MDWKIFNGPFAKMSRRRIIASAIIYGLTLTIRLTSPAGEAPKNAVPPAQSANLPLYSLTSEASLTFRDRPFSFAQPIAFHRDQILASRSRRMECERATPLTSLLDCSPP